MANIKQMNESARELLAEITAKDLNDLTAYDCGFLRARSVYLTAEQKEYFAEVLDGTLTGKPVKPGKK